MSLAERAAEMAGRTDTPPADEWSTSTEPTRPARPAAAEPLPEPDIPEPGPDGPEKLPVSVAWSRVMGDVRKIGKTQDFEGGRAGRFKFRGVDLALNAFGPACRRHGVLVIPVKVESSYRDLKTSSGGNMRECVATVTYRIYGPEGDHIEAQAAGEALDTGGRSTPKAQSIALRTLLLAAGMVPTEETDADDSPIERGEAPIRSVASYRDEVLEENPTARRMHQMIYELRQQKRLNEITRNEHGDEEPIGAFIERHGLERFGGRDG